MTRRTLANPRRSVAKTLDLMVSVEFAEKVWDETRGDAKMSTFHDSGGPSGNMVLNVSPRMASPLKIVENGVDGEKRTDPKDPYKELELYLAKVNVSRWDSVYRAAPKCWFF